MKLVLITILLFIFSCQSKADDVPDSFKYKACYHSYNRIEKDFKSDQKHKNTASKFKSVFFKAGVNSYMTEKGISKAEAKKIMTTPIEDFAAMDNDSFFSFLNLTVPMNFMLKQHL